MKQYNAPRSLRVTAGTVVAALEALGSQRLAVEVSAAHALRAAQCTALPPPLMKQYNAPRRLRVTAGFVCCSTQGAVQPTALC